jgi:hypothetical protein
VGGFSGARSLGNLPLNLDFDVSWEASSNEQILERALVGAMEILASSMPSDSNVGNGHASSLPWLAISLF